MERDDERGREGTKRGGDVERGRMRRGREGRRWEVRRDREGDTGGEERRKDMRGEKGKGVDMERD